MQKSVPGVMVQGIVQPEGTFSDPVLIRSSSDPGVDNRCVSAAAKALYRPARDEHGYIASEAVIHVHLDPVSQRNLPIE